MSAATGSWKANRLLSVRDSLCPYLYARAHYDVSGCILNLSQERVLCVLLDYVTPEHVDLSGRW